MNILIPDSWLREYLETKAAPKQLKDCLSLCGPSVEKIEKLENDSVYNIEITTNRPDMASVLGIAREAAAILPRFNIGAKLNNETIRQLAEQCNNVTITSKKGLPLKVKITNPKLCPRFTAIILDNITIKPSPLFIQDRLEKSGVRALNNVIDVSNYLMRLFGQPVHTFDYDKIKKATMILRESRKGERITTLDGKTFTLPGSDIVIEDGSGRLIDLCGIMGGENSAVDKNTQRVLLFVQNYEPAYIRKTSIFLGQRTEAATLFEKNLDSENILPTLLYGIKLLKETARAKTAGKLIDIYPNPYQVKKIISEIDFINNRLGVELEKKEVVDILNSLGFTVSSSKKKSNKLTITVPSYRTNDISISEDIVEEVARIYGYHNLPSNLMTGSIPITKKPKDYEIELKVKQMLKYSGYTEIYNYSFISEKLLIKAGSDKNYPLKIANPLTEETSYMRVSLVPSMVETIIKNQHITDELSLFEMAKVYIPKKGDLPDEISMLTIVNQLSFYTLKGLVEKLLEELGIADYSQRTEKGDLYWHPKQSINFAKNGSILLTLGRINPFLAANFNIKNDLFITEINFDKLIKYSNPIKKYNPIPAFPPAIEDFSFRHSSKIHIGPLIEEIYKTSPFVRRVEFVGRFKDTTTLRVTYLNPKKNLSQEDIKKLRTNILSVLYKKYNIQLKHKSL